MKSSSSSSNEIQQVSFLSKNSDGAINALTICKYRLVSHTFVPQIPVPLRTKTGCFDISSVSKTKKPMLGEQLLLYNVQLYKKNPSLYGNRDGKSYWISSIYQVLAQILDTEVLISNDYDLELPILSYNHHTNSLVRKIGVLTVLGDPEYSFFGVDEDNNKGTGLQIASKFQISSLPAHK